MKPTPFRQTGRTTKMIRSMPDLNPPVPNTIALILDLDANERILMSEMLLVMYGSSTYEKHITQMIDKIKGAGYSKNVDIFNIKKKPFDTFKQQPLNIQTSKTYNRFDVYVDPSIYDCCTKKEIIEAWDIINSCLK